MSLSSCDSSIVLRRRTSGGFNFVWSLGLLLVAVTGTVRGEPTSATAGNASVTVENIAAGFQSYFKVGEWTPLRLTLNASAPVKVRLLVEASDADDYTAISESQHDLAAGSQQLETSFRTARMQGDIIVRLESPEGKLLYRHVLRPGSDELHPGLRGDCRLRLTLGRSPTSSKPQTDSANSTPGTPVSELWLHFNSAKELPGESRSYESVESLILHTAPAPLAEPRDDKKTSNPAAPFDDLTARQSAAMRQWVADGGHLIVSVGETVAKFPKSKLAEWFPVPLTESQQLRQVPGLENYLGKNVSLKVSGTLIAAQLPDVAGPVVLVRELNGPLVVRVPYGFGRVTVIGLDLNLPFLAESQLEQKLTSSSRPMLAVFGTQGSGRLTNVGVSDLATQLQGSQEDFADVSRIPYWGMMGLLLLYIVVLGPIDYLIVHRWLKRPHLTWITFPLVVCLAAAGSIWGARQHNGRDLRLNQFTLVDLDVDSGRERGRSWCTLLSPQTRRYTLEVTPQPASQWSKTKATAAPVKEIQGATNDHLRLTWVGVPENTVGGLYRSGGLNATGRQYHFPAGGTTPDLPVQQWSTKTVVAEWHGTGKPQAESHLESNGPGRLRGSLVHRLPATLEDCLLVYGGRVYFSDRSKRKLAPGQEWDPTAGQGQQRDLRGFLTGSEASRAQGKQGEEIVFTSRTYDPSASDRLELLRMLSFHQAAGGRGYTGLDHAILSRLELTELAETGRAVLIGRLPAPRSEGNAPVATIRIDDRDSLPGNRDTFVRIVLPVKQIASEIQREIPRQLNRQRSQTQN